MRSFPTGHVSFSVRDAHPPALISTSPNCGICDTVDNNVHLYLSNCGPRQDALIPQTNSVKSIHPKQSNEIIQFVFLKINFSIPSRFSSKASKKPGISIGGSTGVNIFENVCKVICCCRLLFEYVPKPR